MPKRQRIEGLVHRSFALHAVERATDEGATDSGNLVLEFPFSSEEPYLRGSHWDEPWVETLGHAEGECDLTRLNMGAPVLLNHGYDAPEESALRLVGTTTKAWVEDGRGYVQIKMSRRDGMAGLIQDIQDGIVRNVSVGYQIAERTLIKQNEGAPNEYRVTRWVPMEVSIVDLPADSTVGIGRSFERSQNPAHKVINLEEAKTMSIENKIPSGGEQPPDNTEALRAEILAAERTRAADIRVAVRSAGFDTGFADTLIDAGTTVDAARAAVLQKLAERTAATPVSSRADIMVTRDETESRREFMADAILHRASPAHKLTDGARQYAGLTMIELARDCLEIRGVKTRGMDRLQIAARAFEGTSDLPSVLANVANKSLRQAYQSAPRTFTSWARQTTAADFRTITRAALSDTPALETVTENGEFKRGAVTDGKETYQLVTVGKIIGFTRQSIINDDLSALTRVPALFANAAANYESDVVYGILTANANLSDGIALFEAVTHKNLTATGTALSVASLGVARALMRRQTTPMGAVMNLNPEFLIVPAAQETVANQFVSSQYVAAKSADYNPFAGKLQVVAEARLDTTSTLSWYLAAGPNTIDTVEYCYLEGQNGVYLETRNGFEVDGMEIKARLDFAAKAIDYRGLYKNNGA